jgi:hypothetical protein
LVIFTVCGAGFAPPWVAVKLTLEELRTSAATGGPLDSFPHDATSAPARAVIKSKRLIEGHKEVD